MLLGMGPVNLLLAKVKYNTFVSPKSWGSACMKSLSLKKSTSRLCMKISGGTLPEKKLNLMSKNDNMGMFRTASGNGPESKLLLTSSSYKFLSFAIPGDMVPEKLLELAWKRARSGSPSMKPSRVGAASPKPLKSMEATVVAVRLSGGLSQ